MSLFEVIILCHILGETTTEKLPVIFIFVYCRTLAHKILCAIQFRGISGRQSELRPTENPSNRSGSRANWCYKCNLSLAT